MDCSPPGSSVYGILQARMLAWVTLLSSRGAHQAPGHLSCLAWEGHKMQAQPSLRLCGVPEKLSALDLGSASNSGPTSDSSQQSNLEPEQCRLGKHTGQERGQTQCGRDPVSTPHTCQWYLFAVFLLPHNTTEQVSLKKVTTTAPLY